MRNSLPLTSDMALHTMIRKCSNGSRRLSLPTGMGISRRSSLGLSNSCLPVQFRLVQRRMRRFSLPTEEELVNGEAVIYVDPTQKLNKRLRRRQVNPSKQGSRRWETSCRSDNASRESCSMVSRCDSVDSASRGSDTNDSLVDDGDSIGLDEPGLVHVHGDTHNMQLPSKCCQADLQAKADPVLANAPPKRPRRTMSIGSDPSKGIPLEVVIVSPVSVAQAIPLRCDHPSLPDCNACRRLTPAPNCPPKMPRRSSLCSNSSQTNDIISGEMSHSASQPGNSSGSISRNSQFSQSEMSALVADYWDERNDTDKKDSDLNVTNRPQKHAPPSSTAANYWDWNETSMDEDIIMEMARYFTQDEHCSKGSVAASSNRQDKRSTKTQQMANYWDEVVTIGAITNVSKVPNRTSEKKTSPRRSVASRVVANYWDWVVSEIPSMDEDIVSETFSSNRSRQSSIKTWSSLSKGDQEFVSSTSAASSQEKRDQLLYGY